MQVLGVFLIKPVLPFGICFYVGKTLELSPVGALHLLFLFHLSAVSPPQNEENRRSTGSGGVDAREGWVKVPKRTNTDTWSAIVRNHQAWSWNALSFMLSFACGTPVSWHCGERLLNQLNPFPLVVSFSQGFFVPQNRSNLRGQGKWKQDNWGRVDNLLLGKAYFRPQNQEQMQRSAKRKKCFFVFRLSKQKMECWTPKIDPLTPLPGSKIDRPIDTQNNPPTLE